MSGMTSKRLDEIRERATCPSAAQAVQIGEYEACARALVEHDVPDLLAEVKRLREGIALIEALFDPIDYDGGLPGDAVHARNVARSLLNPPTGGETDVRR